MIQVRKKGISVLIVHHNGKGEGGQRGTSKRTDILDTHIQLSRPDDYEDGQGARFEVHIEKGRNIKGEDSHAYEAWLKNDKWEMRAVGESTFDAVVAKLLNDMTIKEVATDMGISTGYVSKLAKKAERERLIPAPRKDKPGPKSRRN